MNFPQTPKFIARIGIRTRFLRCDWVFLAVLSLAAGLRAQTGTPAPTSEFISDQPELVLSSTQSWGELGWDVAAHAGDKSGEPLRIGDRAYRKGLGHHANGSITILLDGLFSEFDAEVGLQPCGAGGSVIFRVFVDGERRFESPVVRAGDAPVLVHVLVPGAAELRLEASDVGDGISCDMANWVNARLTRAAARVAQSEAQRVDIGRFGRVVTWDPNRSDGARADRIQEFQAEDLFLDRELTPEAGMRYAVPMATNQLACIGIQWLNRRALREVRMPFANPAQIPSTNAVRVEGWIGESAWQGAFEPLPGTLERSGGELIFRVAARGNQGGPILTRKLRWVFPATSGSAVVLRPLAYTRSNWAVTNLIVQASGLDKSASAEVELVNGEIVGPQSSGPLRWKLNAPLRMQVRYSRRSPLKSDPTLIQFRLPGAAFSVAVEDVLREGSVFLPDQGVLVTTDPSPVTLAKVKKRVAASKTILEQVRRMPDQTFAQAMMRTHHAAQSEGPVMLSLACANEKFVVERDGLIHFHTATVTSTDWFMDSGEMQPQFGNGKSELVNRQLEGGWLPVPVMTFRQGGVKYAERVFVAPCDEPGPDPGRLNRRSVAVVEFTLTNEQPSTAPARLALPFLTNSRENLAAKITPCPAGWLVAGNNGTIALVRGASDPGMTAAVEGGTIRFTGSLPANGVARFEVLLRASDVELSGLPPIASLRAAFNFYWEAVMASAMQVETPDALLNNIIRSSQVRCLIDARNEADGQRVAAWIAAMSYGPLESEAHSVIRGMAFFGHRDFAQRSLDYFIHRYNTNGFLTTGYTTFGTAWHLWTVGEQFQLYDDQAWLRAAAPDLGRVGEWIVRQTVKTAQPAGAGRPEFGLMPPGVIADWNAFAYHFANNAYYYAALHELGAMFSEIHDPRSASFAIQASRLRDNTLRAYRWTQARSPVVALRNGAWTPHYPSQVYSPGPLGEFFPGQDAGRSWCYDVEIGAHQLVPTGVMDASSREVERMLEHMEDVQFLADGWFDYPAVTNQTDWFNFGGFSKVQPYYTRNAEIYALRDEVKPFLRSYFNALAAMLNPEVLTLWEHFHHSGAWDKTHETGYFLHQTRQMLVKEREQELWLAPLITGDWLADGKSVAVRNAPTRFGPVSYRLASQVREGVIEARIDPPTRSAPKALVLRIRHPDGKKIRGVTVNGKSHRDFDSARSTIRLFPTVGSPITVRARF